VYLQNYQPIRSPKNALFIGAILISSTAMADNDLIAPQLEQEYEISYQIQATNSLWEDKEIDPSFYDSPYQISLFSPQNGEDSDRLLSQTYTVFGLGAVVIATLGAMPSTITNWEEEDDDPALSTKWLENVSAGPVWDRDDWYLNYVAHPYFGGVFYQSARKSGYRQWDAFVYSFMMSTFYWEYGMEAFAEVPSIQDLVVTPVLGWVYGEWAFNTERDIWLNGGTVLGSEILGNTSLFLLDPVDSIGRNVNYLFGIDIIKAGTGYFTFQQAALPYGNGTESEIGLKVSYLFGADDSDALPAISGKTNEYRPYRSHSVDPVDTGIVGISAGAVWLNLDNEWGMKHAYGKQLSAGLYFTRSISARLNYSRADLQEKQNSKSIIYENYSLDLQYYLNTQSDWRPFITAGVGEMMREQERNDKRFQINGGLGLHYKINNNWAVQSDWRHYYSPRTDAHENQLGSAIIYRFGKGEWSL
jgi:hypothetical protein